MKFDKIIGNPPYPNQRSTFPIHIAILQMCKKFSSDIVWLAPIGWLQDPLWKWKKNNHKQRYLDLAKHIDKAEILDACIFNSEFDNMEGSADLGIYHVGPNEGKPCECYRDVPFIEAVLYKIMEDPSIQSSTYATKKPTTEYFVTLPRIHGHHGRLDAYDHYDVFSVKKEVVRSLCRGSSGVYLSFNSDEEAENCRKSLMAPIVKYINYNCKRSMTNHIPVIPYMKDYSHVWTDKDYQEYFNLSDEMVKKIENIVAGWNKKATKYYLENSKI